MPCVAVLLRLLARVDVGGSFGGQLLPATVVLAFGLAIGLPALQNAALHQLSDEDAGLGSGVQTSVQQLGSATGLAVLTTIALSHATSIVGTAATPAEATVAGYRLAFVVATAVLVAGAAGVGLHGLATWAASTPGARRRGAPAPVRRR